jgi:hypothetical protein
MFRINAKQAKKSLFFASKRKKCRFRFASFRFEAKMTAHPNCDVVLVRRTIDLGCWEFGMGRDGRDGEGEVSSRVTWDQGGQDRTTSKEGFQVSKRDLRKRGNWQKGWQGKPEKN